MAPLFGVVLADLARPGCPESAILRALGRRLHLRVTMSGPSTVCTSKSASFRYDGLAIGKEDQAAAAAAAAA